MSETSIVRSALVSAVRAALRASPIAALLGPRQCGKTTLARHLHQSGHVTLFDLEDPRDTARLSNPMRVLDPLQGLVILDEIQRRPDLLPVLRVLADRQPRPCRFLVLGSASPELVRGASESLAGRVRFVEMGGLSLAEVGSDEQPRLWLRGGFPRSFLARSERDSLSWREDFIRTFVERDIPQLDVRIPALVLRRFWAMVAHYHGQLWNGSEIAGSLGVAHTTTRRYLDLLTGAYVIRQLPPFFANTGKRLVRSPKIYVRDSGLLHALLGLQSRAQLESHPKLGASFEGFAVEEVLRWAGERNSFFWATHGGAELDLLVVRGGRRYGFEFKCSDAPSTTKSMRVALADLDLHTLWVVHPGRDSYPLDHKIEALALRDLDRVRTKVMRAGG